MEANLIVIQTNPSRPIIKISQLSCNHVLCSHNLRDKGRLRKRVPGHHPENLFWEQSRFFAALTKFVIGTGNARDGMGWDGTGRDGMGQDRTGRDGTDKHRDRQIFLGKYHFRLHQRKYPLCKCILGTLMHTTA